MNTKAKIITAVVLTAICSVSGTVLLQNAVRENMTFDSGNKGSLERAEAAASFYQSRAEEFEKQLIELRIDQYNVRAENEKRITALEEDIRSMEKMPENEFDYITEGQCVKIERYHGAEREISLPRKIDGLNVKTVGRDAFRNSSVEKVILPDGIETIDWFAFYGCYALKEISIPGSVKRIEYGAFEGCPSLVFICEKDFYAEKYADSYGIEVVLSSFPGSN